MLWLSNYLSFFLTVNLDFIKCRQMNEKAASTNLYKSVDVQNLSQCCRKKNLTFASLIKTETPVIDVRHMYLTFQMRNMNIYRKKMNEKTNENRMSNGGKKT